MAQIEYPTPAGLVASPAFSHVAVIPPGATTIVVGGQNAVDADGALVGEGDVAAQVERVMANIVTALAAADASMADVVSMTVVLVDGIDINAAYGAAAASIPTDRPAPLVSAAFVPALGVPGALVEVSALAAVVRDPA
jgi:enamine deaminase RidA (YjgF/YER057c/UK114 family)